MKRKNMLVKLSLFFIFAFAMIISFVVPTNAYYFDNTTGNIESSNLYNVGVYTDPDLSFDISTGSVETINDSSSAWSHIAYTIESNTQYTISFTSEYQCWFVYSRDNNSLYNVRIASGSHTITFTSDNNYIRFYFNWASEFYYRLSLSSLMLVKGSSAIPFEPYGVTFYSQTNYENYGSSQYSQGYTDGFNSIYNSLLDVNLSEHVTGIGCGIYDSTGSTFVQHGTITSSYFATNYYYFSVSPVTANNYYVIPISFDNNYIFSSFRWTPNRFTSPELTINGVIYDSTTVTYNGSSYGWDNLNVNLDSATNSIEFKFKINSNFEGLFLYINGKNLEISSALESYQTGFDNGESVGYQNGYSDGFVAGSSSITTDNTNFQKLIWTIGATPFESFKTIFDVNVMGLNISGIILGGVLALLILYLIKKIWK